MSGSDFVEREDRRKDTVPDRSQADPHTRCGVTVEIHYGGRNRDRTPEVA